MSDDARYGIGDLAALGGVSRRTVRFYVQEGLLPPPLGVGRGDHYGPDHLERLLRVKALQETGRTLDEIRRVLDEPARMLLRARFQAAAPALASAPALETPRTLWRRLELAPGVELHVSTRLRLPSPSKLQELVEWCRVHLPGLPNPTDPEE
jgi:DNA-binding transcriptional MerR regulator